MSRKVTILRSEEFAVVEDELAAALDQLEASNTRIQALLESERAVLAESSVEGAAEEAAPSPEGAEPVS